MLRKVTPGTASRLTTADHTETYGRHLLRRVVAEVAASDRGDLGRGAGDDLAIVRERHQHARRTDIDFGPWNRDALLDRGIAPGSVDIEREPLPFAEARLETDFFRRAPAP